MTTVPRLEDPTLSYTAAYDAWHRLVKLADGENAVQTNEYDGLRRRTVKKKYSSGILGETRHYYPTFRVRSRAIWGELSVVRRLSADAVGSSRHAQQCQGFPPGGG